MTKFDINDLPKIGDIIVSEGQEFVVDSAGIDVARYGGISAEALNFTGLMSLKLEAKAGGHAAIKDEIPEDATIVLADMQVDAEPDINDLLSAGVDAMHARGAALLADLDRFTP